MRRIRSGESFHIPAAATMQEEIPQEDSLPTPFESAQLNLKLFELRRETVLRQARAWFVGEFHPETFEEVMAAVRGEHNTWIRMVMGYWDMAASLVTTGAIDSGAFLSAHSEIFATFSKVQPFLGELREAFGEPKMFGHIEEVVMAAPDAAARLEKIRTRLRTMAKMRREAASAQA